MSHRAIYRFGNRALASRCGVSVAALAACCIALPAHAQTAPVQTAAATGAAQPVQNAGLEDIVVTARRVAENLQDVPVAVTAFTGAQLESKNALQISDVAAFTPGFSVRQPSRNPTALTLSVRGQAQNDVIATLDPSIGTYVDEIYWARAYGLNAGLVDIANIQVLKGPQGTLFGRNTSGGALVVTTNDPNFNGISGRVSASYGRFNERVGEIALNVPLGEVIALRGAFKINKRDGWAHEVALFTPAGVRDNSNNPNSVFQRTGRKYNNRDELQGRLKALVQISDSAQLLLSGEWYDYDSATPARQTSYKIQLNNASDNVAVATPINRYIDYFRSHPNAVGADAHSCVAAVSPQPAANCAFFGTDRDDVYAKVTTQTYGAKLSADTSFGQVKFISGYRQVKSNSLLDQDGSGVVIHSGFLDLNLKQYSFEAQATGTLLDLIDFAAGATYFRETGRDGVLSFTNASGNPTANLVRQAGTIENDSMGLYGQASAHVTDKLTLTGGLRYSIDDKTAHVISANITRATGAVLSCFVGGTPATNCDVGRHSTFSALSWTASADYKISQDILVYIKASRGYRSGGQNFAALSAAQFMPFQPEFVYEQEAGIKSELFDRRVRINISAYRNLLKGAQRSAIVVTNGVNNTLISNAAEARNLGVEADLQVSPVRGLTFTASGSINDAKYLKFSDATGDRTGERFILVPKYQYSLSGEYVTDLTDSVSARLNVDYSWLGKQSSSECVVSGGSICYTGTPDINGRTAAQISQDVVNATTIPSAGIVNARLTFGLDKDAYTLAFWGRNITDNREQVNNLRVPAPMRNYVSIWRREPVSYGLTVAAKF